jgi:sodium/proline symporter
VVVWKQMSGGIFDLYEIVPGVLVSFVTVTVVTLVGRGPPAEVAETFDRAVGRLT